MAREKEEYVVGILVTYKDKTEIKYVTNVSSEPKVAKLEDGKEAMTFSKVYAKDLAWGLTLNGNPAIAILKESYLNLINPEAAESEEE